MSPVQQLSSHLKLVVGRRNVSMCVRLAAVLAVLLSLQLAGAQERDWALLDAWSGSVTSPQESTIRPGARHNSAFWTGKDGAFYLFGGYAYTLDGGYGLCNDVWKLDVATSTCTQVKGTNETNQSGTYGTKGVANDTNMPGARYAAAAWTGADGSLYLFGGQGTDGTGTFGDLWKYDTTTTQWTYLNGSSSANSAGAFGPLGGAGADYCPGSRYGAASWTAADGKLYLYGGYGYDAYGAAGYLSDFWVYNPSTNQWAWIGGNFCLGNYSGVYVTKGVANLGRPGARYGAVAVTAPDGTFYLFGGYGCGEGNSWSELNDLWSFNPTTGLWTWLSGSRYAAQAGIYGTQLVADTANAPGGRRYAAGWVTADGTLYLFGGYGRGWTGSSSYLGDLWAYLPGSNQWMWVRGSSMTGQAGVFSTAGAPAMENNPGARCGAVSYVGPDGTLYLGCGFGYDCTYAVTALGDLWRATPVSRWQYSADTSVTQEMTTLPLTLGQDLLSTITITNNGPAKAKNVMLSDQLSTSIAYLSGSITRKHLSNAIDISTVTLNTSNTLIGTFGTLLKDEVVTVTLRMLPIAPGESTSTAAVTSDQEDFVTENNITTTTIKVVMRPGPDMCGNWSTTTTVSASASRKGGTTYSIKGALLLWNLGNQTAKSFSVEFRLADGPLTTDKYQVISASSFKNLKVGKSTKKSFTLKLPAGVKPTGKYLVAVIDPTNVVVEGNEFNNTMICGPFN